MQIAPFMLRRTKSQVAHDLPDKIVIDQLCPVTKRQAKEYSAISRCGSRTIGEQLFRRAEGPSLCCLERFDPIATGKL